MESRKRSSRTHISRSEYYQLIGLLMLAQKNTERNREIERTILGIVSEIEPDGSPVGVWGGGHVSDQMCDLQPDADEMLSKLGLEVDSE